MTNKQYLKLVELIKQTSKEVILKSAGLCDGHTIMKPEAFTDAGLPEEVVIFLTRTYKSDGSPKGTIFVNGEAVKELKGIYGLDALRFIAGALDIEYEPKMGRGFEAQSIYQALYAHFNKPTDNSPSPSVA